MLLWIAAAVLVFGTSARAQTVNGVELSQEVGNELKKVFADPNFWSEAVIREAWVKLIPTLNAEINKALPGVPNLPSGIGIYNVDSRLSQDCTAMVRLTDNSIKIRITAKNNSVYFKTTTPDIVFGIGLDRDADPAFSLGFDAECEASISLTNGWKDLTLGPASLTVFNANWDSQNFTGDLVKAADSIYKFFTHKDFMAKLLKPHTVRFHALQVKLNRLNTELGKLSSQGYKNWIMPTVEHGRKLHLKALPPELTGIVLDQVSGKGHKKLFADPKFWSGKGFKQAWDSHITELKKAFVTAATGDPHFAKLTHVESRIGKDCNALIHLVKDSVRIRLVMQYNSISYRNPKGKQGGVAFCLVLDMKLSMPANGHELKLESPKLTMSNVHENGAAAEDGAIRQYVEGAEFMAKVMQHCKLTFPALEKELEKINAEITKAKPHGKNPVTFGTDSNANLKLTLAQSSSTPPKKK
jgi:hypothetical protein